MNTTIVRCVYFFILRDPLVILHIGCKYTTNLQCVHI